MFNIDDLDWEKTEGLLPAVIQHAHTGRVLMLGFMNKEALEQTISSQQVVFYSRSKKRLWLKGETSGNFLKLQEILPDCDKDSLLILALPKGPTCHLNLNSCYGETSFSMALISSIESIIEQRKKFSEEGSYVNKLFERGVNRIAQKVGEEAVETAIAAVLQDNQEFCAEMADLFFHMQVLLSAKGHTFLDVIEVMKQRLEKCSQKERSNG